VLESLASFMKGWGIIVVMAALEQINFDFPDQ
jgi:hypothetical protein